LARVMQKNRRPELVFIRLDLQDKFQLGTLQRPEIAEALQSFPEDPELLFYSCRLFLRMNDYKNALREARRLQTLQPENLEIGMMVIAALDAGLDFTAAEEEFGKYRRKYPENLILLNNYWNFCYNLKLLDRLQNLCQDLQKQAIPEQQEYLPVIQAQIASWQNNPQQTENLLKSFHSNNPELLFHAAYNLARIGQNAPAIKLYQQIPAEFSRAELTQLNLAELLADEGQNAAALEVARQAWLKNPDSPLTRECYGLRLHQNGEDEQAVETLAPLLRKTKNNPRVAEAWQKSMQNQIEASFAAGKYQRCREHCERMLLYFPENKTAENFLTRVNQEIAKSEAQDAAGNNKTIEK